MSEGKGKQSLGAALEGFYLVAKSSTGKACVMVIQQALKHPQIYVFGELLDLPNVQELETTEHKPWLDLLRLFAYGTWTEYQENVKAKQLPELSAALSEKLKKLSLVSLAAENQTLKYDYLQAQLGLSNVRELEDCIIACVYQGLVQGSLDQRKAQFEVLTCIGRDIGPDDVDHMTEKLQNWLSASQNLVENLQNKMEEADRALEYRIAAAEEIEDQKKSAMVAIKEQEAAQAAEMGGEGYMGNLLGGLADVMGGGGARRGPGGRSQRRRGPPSALDGFFRR